MKTKNLDWEAIRQDHRVAKFPSVRALAKHYKISHTLIYRRIKKNRKEWQQDLSKQVKSAVRSKLVSRKAKEIVSTLETGNIDEINKKAEELSDEETIEYAALSDLAFLNDWHKRFSATLEAVSKIKKDLLSGWVPAKYEKNKNGEVEVTAIKPLGSTSRTAMLNSIAQAEHKIYHDMRKNLNLEDGPKEPDETEYSEADKDDLKRTAVEVAKGVVKNG